MCAVIGLKSMLYESIDHRTELKLSRHLPNSTCSTFSRTSLSFSFANWKWNFATSEKRFAKMSGAVIYIIVTWAETKILKDKTKQKVQVFKVFMLS